MTAVTASPGIHLRDLPPPRSPAALGLIAGGLLFPRGPGDGVTGVTGEWGSSAGDPVRKRNPCSRGVILSGQLWRTRMRPRQHSKRPIGFQRVSNRKHLFVHGCHRGSSFRHRAGKNSTLRQNLSVASDDLRHDLFDAEGAQRSFACRRAHPFAGRSIPSQLGDGIGERVVVARGD